MKKSRKLIYAYKIEKYIKNDKFCKRLLKIRYYIKSQNKYGIEHIYIYGTKTDLQDKEYINNFVNNLSILVYEY